MQVHLQFSLHFRFTLMKTLFKKHYFCRFIQRQTHDKFIIANFSSVYFLRQTLRLSLTSNVMINTQKRKMVEAFLNAVSHLYQRVCPSIHPSVCRSIRRSVTPVQKRDPGASNGQYWLLFTNRRTLLLFDLLQAWSSKGFIWTRLDIGQRLWSINPYFSIFRDCLCFLVRQISFSFFPFLFFLFSCSPFFFLFSFFQGRVREARGPPRRGAWSPGSTGSIVNAV